MNSAEHFETIVKEHYEALFRFALSLTRVESDAQDLTQQTFYVWALKGHQLRDRSKAKAWLFTTLHRAFLNGRRREIRFSDSTSDELADLLPLLPTEGAPSRNGSQVLAALGKIDPIYQAVVALFYLEDYSQKEIAAILEVPIGTVKSRIARGVAQLRETLLAQGFSDSSLEKDEIQSTAEPAESPALPGLVPPLGGSRAEFVLHVEEPGDEWESLRFVTNTVGNLSFSEPTANLGPQRFYRVQLHGP